MAELTPTAADAEYPSLTAWALDNAYDVGTRGSPNAEWWDSWAAFQTIAELLEHQDQLNTQLTPAGNYSVALADNAGVYSWAVKDSDGATVFKVDSNGVVTIAGGIIGVPRILDPQEMGTPSSNPAVLDELNNASAMKFIDAATRSIIINHEVQDASTDIELVWCTSATSGNVRFQLDYRTTSDGDAMNGAWTTTNATDAAGPYAYSQVTTVISLTGLTVGDTLMMKVGRLGGNVLDTIGQDMYLMLARMIPV